MEEEFNEEDLLIVETIRSGIEDADEDSELTANDVLRAAFEHGLEGVAIVGFDKDGIMYFAGNKTRYQTYFMLDEFKDFLRNN